MAVTRPSSLAAAAAASAAALALLLGAALPPRAVAEATTSSVFTLLAELQEQQMLRRQAARESGGTLSLLQRSEPASGQDTAEKTFRGLDTNRDGLLSREEIATFATSQGLDAASAKSELALLDTDGDGALNMNEFAGVLSASGDAGEVAALEVAVAPPVPQQLVPPPPLPALQTAEEASQTQVASAVAAAPPPPPVAGSEVKAAVSPVALPALSPSTGSLEGAAAGSDNFVSVRAKQLLASWNKFESDAKHAEAEAAALRAKAREELREAQELTAIADFALTRARQAATGGTSAVAAAAAAAQGAASGQAHGQ